MNKCFICFSTKHLKPYIEEWDMVDGSHHKENTHMCNGCCKEAKELEEFKMPGGWVDTTLDKIMGGIKDAKPS